MNFDTYNDALYAHTDWRKVLARHFPEMGKAWLADRWSRYGPNAALPSKAAWDHIVEDTLGADVCWMTHEMMDLVQHAMVDFDEEEPVTLDDVFIPHGFMVLPEPFHSLDIHGKRMAQRVYMWRLVTPIGRKTEAGDGAYNFSYDLNSEGEEVAGIRFYSLSHVDDVDDYPLDGELLERAHTQGFEWNVAHATAVPLELMHNRYEMKGEGDKDASWFRFWRVTQKLMGERIITSERRPASRPARREAARFKLDVSNVRVIELRRPRGSSNGVDREGPINWTHRWINRGHWRNQWYPASGVHRQKWIGEYVKGPENLPLVIRQRVWNWDR